MSDSIYALSSGRPPAAIAVIRISGPAAVAAVAVLCGSLPKPRQAAVRTLSDPATGAILDQALVLRFIAPHSATGEDLVELHCHGGKAVTDAVLAALSRVDGLRLAEPGEFTRRTFANGRIDLTEAEGLADLLEAETEAQRRAALALAEGGLRRRIDQWQGRLLELSARAELAIDYVGEEDEEQQQERNDIGPAIQALRDELYDFLQQPRIEPLKEGFRIVIAGPPNAGKSSLFNALVGLDRAIVTAEAGTTRDHIDVPLAVEGLPIVLTDTAGLRETGNAAEVIGVGRSRQLLEAADLVLWLGDPEEAPDHRSIIQVRAKADLPQIAEQPLPKGAIATSSATGQGIASLLEAIVDCARSTFPIEGQLALNARQARLLLDAFEALDLASASDVLIQAEALRGARQAFDRITGRAGVEDFLDAMFGRFCLGK